MGAEIIALTVYLDIKSGIMAVPYWLYSLLAIFPMGYSLLAIFPIGYSLLLSVSPCPEAFMRRAGVSKADMEQEVQVMEACDHANILRLFAHFEE